MKFSLEIPPSANHFRRVIVTLNGREITRDVKISQALSSVAKQYKAAAGWILKQKRINPIAGDVAVIVTVHRKRRAGDLDNYLKVLLDSLSGIAWGDDKQVAEIYAVRRDGSKNPRVDVHIQPAGETPLIEAVIAENNALRQAAVALTSAFHSGKAPIEILTAAGRLVETLSLPPAYSEEGEREAK